MAPPPSPTTGPLPEIVYAPKGKPKATVIALHGFNDHASSFEWIGDWLAERGYKVVAYDQAGFGARPDRGYWPGADKLVRELVYQVQVEKTGAPDVPVWILGESMGSTVALVAAGRAKGQLDVAGLILGSPGVWGGDQVPGYMRHGLTSLAKIAPDKVLTGSNLDILASDNIPMLRALARDPLYMNGARVDALDGLIKLMDEAVRLGPAIDLPVTILDGDRDQVIVPKIQKAFVRAMPAATCRAIRYPNGWHLLMRDLDRQVVYQDVLHVLEGERPGVPCGPRADEPPPRP